MFFLETYNGRSLFLEGPISSRELELFTDASGSVGFGAYFLGNWCAERWPQSWKDLGLVRNLAFLELFPIVVAVDIWGEQLRNRKVRFMCDNMGVVQAINRQTANSRPVVGLLRHLVIKGLSLNAHFTAVHVPGVQNNIADSLSRFQVERFQELAPDAAEVGGLVVRHKELEKVDEDFIQNDGVHPNEIGLDLWTLGIKEGIEAALQVWRDGST